MPDTSLMQRVRGEAHVTLGRHGLRDLRQAGSAKAILPRTDAPEPEVVFLNTAGGITSGDRLDYMLTLGSGARATAGTQTAERAYRATDGPGRVVTTLKLGAGAHLDWLPQEIIAFEGCDLSRITQVEMAGDATFLGVDTVVLGREAHGETLRAARLDDLRRITRDGVPLHIEHLTLGPDMLNDPACLGGARAMATLVMAGPAVSDALGPLRAVLSAQHVTAHASAWDGRLVARFLSRHPAPLRRALVSAILTLRGRPMPRVWQCEVTT